MTSIKPPQSPSTQPIEPGTDAEGAGSTGAVAGPLTGPVAGPPTGPEAPTGVAASQAAAPGDPIAALAADVQAGRIEMSEAVERLVERTIAQLGGRLSAEERAGLGAVLREALESDPVLSSLR
jgi:hypothetical protein